jgi:hypothetical protein
VDGTHVTGSIEMAVRDAELAIGVDANHDGRITWGELRASEPQLIRYLEQHVQLSAQGQRCALALQSLKINDRVDGSYAWLSLDARCPVAVRQLGIGGADAQPAFTVYAPSKGRAFVEYLRAGIWHIWDGIDHLLFLVSLLLPAVLLRRNGHWEPVPRARPAFMSILKVVTAFTLAHSITLSLAALDVVRLPSRLTESVIAASIVIAALNNIFPLVTESRARIAFAFGLLHGFGFASVLADMGLPQGARLVSLVAFNLGIETGQLAVVLAVMPLVYAMRSSLMYRRALLPWGSAAIASLALMWLVQRAFLPGG